jgi:hypothetical protein
MTRDDGAFDGRVPPSTATTAATGSGRALLHMLDSIGHHDKEKTMLHSRWFTRKPILTPALTSVLTFALPLLLTGCGASHGGASAAGGGDAPPPPCSPAEAPFTKVMNPSFANDYSKCTVTMRAKFNSADWGVAVGGEIDGLVKWSAVGPDDAGPDFKFMYVVQAKSDVLFALKKGDPVTVKGRAEANSIGQALFFASEITRGGK